jgi:hypothetical protein
MFLQMAGLPLGLIIIGGLACLVAVGDPQNHSPLTRYLGFIFLFSGLAAFSFSFGLSILLDEVFGWRNLASIGFLAGYVLGGVGGAILGFVHAFNFGKRRRG